MVIIIIIIIIWDNSVKNFHDDEEGW